MNFNHEFGTINLILDSKFETRGVDAFVLSLIKVEKQIRRIFTYLIFQNPNYGLRDILELRNSLAQNNSMYFENFIKGIDTVYTKSVKEIYGENYDADFAYLKEIVKDRNKIFHGQVTNKSLTREELVERVEAMKKWSKIISDRFSEEIQYDGFGRNSYRKSSTDLGIKNLENFSSIENYRRFLKTIDRNAK